MTIFIRILALMMKNCYFIQNHLENFENGNETFSAKNEVTMRFSLIRLLVYAMHLIPSELYPNLQVIPTGSFLNYRSSQLTGFPTVWFPNLNWSVKSFIQGSKKGFLFRLKCIPCRVSGPIGAFCRFGSILGK